VRSLKFCSNCGVKLEFQQAKFCPECGAALAVKKEPSEPDLAKEELIEEDSEISIYELGNKLEEVVERIYKSKGYITTRRQRVVGRSGTKSEIDIIAKKGNRAIAIECKNYSGAVGIDKVRDFSEKLRDIELEGVFVALNGLTQDAEQYASSRHIETYDSGELMEKWWAISVGRGESVKGQSLTLEYALPINITFSQATRIDIANKGKVRVSEAELIFHPYFFAEYSFGSEFRDPTKELHRFKDAGTIFVDALDGKVLNHLPQTGMGIIKSIISMGSSTARAENSRNKKLLTELQNKNLLPRYEVDIKENYKANKLKPAISIKQAMDAVIDFIKQKNTFDVEYTPKSQEDEWIPESKYVTFVPKNRDIRIRRKDVAIIPRWSIEFESSNRSYRREVLACSGEILEDTMSYCPEHFKIGGVSVSQKRTVAVCEVCGEALCADNVVQCAVCGKWLCENDSFHCEVCNNRFCNEHEHQEC